MRAAILWIASPIGWNIWRMRRLMNYAESSERIFETD
jgi:hypothetical protein